MSHYEEYYPAFYYLNGFAEEEVKNWDNVGVLPIAINPDTRQVDVLLAVEANGQYSLLSTDKDPDDTTALGKVSGRFFDQTRLPDFYRKFLNTFPPFLFRFTQGGRSTEAVFPIMLSKESDKPLELPSKHYDSMGRRLEWIPYNQLIEMFRDENLFTHKERDIIKLQYLSVFACELGNYCLYSPKLQHGARLTLGSKDSKIPARVRKLMGRFYKRRYDDDAQVKVMGFGVGVL